MSIYCGIDWAEHHHDIAVVDEAGQVLAQHRVGDDLAGFTALTELLARLAPSSAEVDIAIETDRALFVHALVAAGYRVYAVNPKAVDRYRDRYRVSRAKSDGADALVLAHLARTDRSQHRRIPTDSDLAAAVSVLARAHQDAVRERGRLVRRLRSQLREYYPAALEAFKDLSIRTAVTILSAAPTPALAGRMLGEFGDDPDRFVDAARRRDYAGTAPITKASGKSRVVLMRRTRNTRLSGACRDWAFTASNQSPGAHAYYLHRRMAGDGHEAALRRLGNNLVGQLRHCLEHREPYREEIDWPSTIAA